MTSDGSQPCPFAVVSLILRQMLWTLALLGHAKAKEEPGRRLHALIDKVWREDFLKEAWRQVCRNGGSAGVDGETFADIGSYGVDRWLGELARELRDATYTPKPVRQVLIPKKQPGKFRPLGIPCIRDRVAQTSAMLVLTPIFEADLQPEQYAYRPGRSAHDAASCTGGKTRWSIAICPTTSAKSPTSSS